MDPTLRRISIPFGFVVPLHSTLRWKEQPSLLKLKSQTSMLIYTLFFFSTNFSIGKIPEISFK